MSNLETAPEEVVCEQGRVPAGPEMLVPRDVPLGGPRAMTVRRTLPQRARSLIGAWCFLDHYGPDAVGASGGMSVPRHPHTGLQTVSWLFTGEVEHRDSAGFHAIVRPGELNLMTAGRGISHSEFSTGDTVTLHGAQLWTALPDAARHAEPGFEHYRPEPVRGDGWELRVFLGSLGGDASPVRTHTPLLGAEILLAAGSTLELDLDPAFEHGILLDAGELRLDGHAVPRDHLAYLPTGSMRARLDAGAADVRALLIGGEPLGEQIVMWWNFVGRSHDEVATYRAQWQAEIGAEPPAPGDASGPPRFGSFPAGQPAPLPAPALPNVRLRPRG
ncbi:pirin family protein [Arthrobacter halodurans]|uniref:Pirin family protein n=1 Tax=Arthrobacter halodurans TaxID=516699 RepID=A0ABV4UIZ7_9MICC